jgi:hypothetical protein
VLFTRALRHCAANGDAHVLARPYTYDASRSLTARHSNGSGAPLQQTPAGVHEPAEPCGTHFPSLRLTRGAHAEPERCRSWEDAMKRNPSVTRMRKNPRHWKQHLQRLIDQHNHLHATKRKGVSFKTMEDRANFLFHFFGELHHNEQKCFKPCPENLNNTHVKFMVERWVRQGAPASTLQLRLSFLRTFCGWIHKDGMIYPPERYVNDPSLVKRVYAARKDKSWTSHEVIPDAKIDEIEQFDPYVGAQLRMALRYGLRVKVLALDRDNLRTSQPKLDEIASVGQQSAAVRCLIRPPGASSSWARSSSSQMALHRGSAESLPWDRPTQNVPCWRATDRTSPRRAPARWPC